MTTLRYALFLLSLSLACGGGDGGSGGDDGGRGECPSLPDGGLQQCNPDCPGSWPDACNPPAACLADLAEGSCLQCDEDTGEWVEVIVESFCQIDAGA